ncbi:tyrosine-type recombinase/integrase [Undibacterium sp. FT147W]|uniref:Tyrosine-type recombinase/integrase n=1 Tax=Undibacterium rivi TaxID=2828729 RepID=A0ABS5H0X1_9BURK|nr:tyrosine-type recombinase/integrase [Undibacterium rivi]MBR7792353.1 tyrosine-type recombinase/integrase [Undibacterium rivi]
MALTAKQIDAAKPKDKPYKIRDIEGLYLYISAAGSKSWKCDCDVDGRRTTITYGKYPDLSLADARLKNLERKKAPVERVKTAPTFRDVAREWLEKKVPSLSNSKHQHQTITSLEQFISKVGDLAIDKMPRTTLVKAIQEFADTPESARRLAGRVTMVMDYAMDLGYLEQHSASNLTRVLPSVRERRHMACIDISDAPKLFNDIRSMEQGVSKQALLLLAYTFVRTNELIKAKLDEFDFENKVWVIPAERMKLRKPHVVPLTPQSMSIITDLADMTCSEYLLESPVRRGQPITDNSMLFALYRLGYRGKMTGHGFRALASTVLNQQTQFNRDWIERQLAHKETDDVRLAYNRADYYDQRVVMMRWYSNWIDAQI